MAEIEKPKRNERLKASTVAAIIDGLKNGSDQSGDSTFVDANGVHHRNARRGPPTLDPIWCHNDTGVDLEVGHVGGIDSSEFDLTDEEGGGGGEASGADKWLIDAGIRISHPEVAKHLGQFAVAIDPIPSGKYGWASVCGTARVRINVAEGQELVRYCDITDSKTEYLVPRRNGTARILLPRTLSVGEQWVLVALNSPAQPYPFRVSLDDDLEGGEDNTVSATAVDDPDLAVEVNGWGFPAGITIPADSECWVQLIGLTPGSGGSGSGSDSGALQCSIVSLVPTEIEVQTDVRIDGRDFQKKRKVVFVPIVEDQQGSGEGSGEGWETYHTGTRCNNDGSGSDL